MKILFTGGGTAGHILPIIAIAREIKKIYLGADLKLEYMGPKDDFAQLLLSQEGIEVKNVPAGKIRRYFSPQSFFANIFDVLIRIPLGIFLAFFRILFSAPDLIFSKGGYGSLPAVFAGWLLRTPIFLHEGDAAPGKANVFLSRFALEVFVSFDPKLTESLSPKKMAWTGNPIREEILGGNPETARKMFEITNEKPVVLVLGGSQGAQKINEMILEILPFMLPEFEIIHQCGEKNFKQVSAEAGVMINGDMAKYYHLFPFLRENELKAAYSASDIVVSRAGAGSIFEIAAIGKPSILIPLQGSAQNHQMKNAYTYAEKDAALVIEESNLTPHFFLEKIKFLIERPGEIEKMKNAAKEFSKPEAAKIIARHILEFLLK